MATLDMTEQRPWWKEPMVWLIAVLPATAVVAGFATYFIAAHEPDTLVRSDFRKEGFALVEQVTDADRRAAELGMIARLMSDGERLNLTINSVLPVLSARLSLTVIHPTQESQDLHVTLERAPNGAYLGQLPRMGEGKRLLVLESEDHAWRISGRWIAPFSGTVELAAKADSPSNSPSSTRSTPHP